MPMIEIKISKVQFHLDGYHQEWHTWLKQNLRLAAAEWLTAVIEQVPVDTGMARGSLKPLGDYLGVDVFAANSLPNEIKRASNGDKTMAAGIAVGRQPSMIFGGNAFIYTFKWDYTVEHFVDNEYNAHPEFKKTLRPPPWDTRIVGHMAFHEYMITRMAKRFPKLTDYMVQTKFQESIPF